MSRPVYAQRPSKDVTRRIFVEMLRRVAPIADPKDYQYVGFGALEFLDFDLVHRALGIDDMYSIEMNTDLSRYEANKPYRCIEMVAGRSSAALTRIKWRKLSIVWLDYESTLSDEVFSDLEYLASTLIPGSVLAVTLNADPGRLSDRAARFEQIVGASRVPSWASNASLGEWGWAKAQQGLVYQTLRNRLSKRADVARWHQVLNINYRDSARMQMICGVVVSPSLEIAAESCRFERAQGYSPGQKPVLVEIPYLTPAEEARVRKSLPVSGRRRPARLPGVDNQMIQKYADYYQWIGV